jgi:uncharacterized protein (DUF58 family)
MKMKKNLLSKKELLDLLVHHRVRSAFPGDWESIFKGAGFEFWSLREMAPSDSIRCVDWRATAKTGRHYVREYLAESNACVMLLYDISASVSFGRKELLQANIAAALAYTACVSNNACGLILFADDVKQYIPPRMGTDHFTRLLSAVAEAEPLPCSTTDLSPALRRLIEVVPESLTFILSDFMYPFQAVWNFTDLPGPGTHEVKGLRILEVFETCLPKGSGLVWLDDYETGEKRILDLGKRNQYNQKMEEKTGEIQRQLNAAGIDVLTLTPADNYVSKINSFMQKW